ncbi:MAG: antibiotic biosynthesis monooxygenase [Gemmatimonadales bacterium]
MAHVRVRHRVNDYATWRAAFEAGAERRARAGEVSARVFQLSENSNHVIGLFEWDSLDNAKHYFEGAELQKAMDAAGVPEAPDVYFLNEAGAP